MIDRSASLPISRQARLLDLSRSSVYYRPLATSGADLKLMAAIDEVHTELPFYGARKIRGELRDRGFVVGRGHVSALMRRMGITAIAPKRRLSKPAPGHKIYPYLLLTAIMDWASRRVLSWRLSNTLDAGFCIEALEEALQRYDAPQIFNSDQGAQFTCEGFTSVLADHGVQISMDGRGRWLDNVFIERLWRSVKHEEVYLKAYENLTEARRELGAYFDFYNRRRRHQGLADRTPDEVYWSTLRRQATAA